jgi:hypothetical protein
MAFLPESESDLTHGVLVIVVGVSHVIGVNLVTALTHA